MEKMRYTDRLYGVFNLPPTAELACERNEPTCIMMVYNRATDVKKFEILEKRLPADVREKIVLWLHKSSHLLDVTVGLT